MHKMAQDIPTCAVPDDPAAAREERRQRLERLIAKVHEWMADESGFEEATWDQLKQNIEAHRLSPRKRFRD